MAKQSAGLLLYRRGDQGSLELLVVHPGGPFFAKKDAGAWSIPKGLIEGAESPLLCAKREAEEELGAAPPAGPYLDLGEVKQKGGKSVLAFAAEFEFSVAALQSNTFELEWPPKSGRKQTFPEVDRAAWLSPDEARRKLNPAQAAFVDRLLQQLGSPA